MADQEDVPGRGVASPRTGNRISATLRLERGKARKSRKAAKNGSRSPCAPGAEYRLQEMIALKPKPPDLISRLHDTCTAQLDRIEAKLSEMGAKGGDLGDLDKTMKMLAGLARTLELLTELRKSYEKEVADGDDNVDPDHLRSELAKRLLGLCKGRENGSCASEPQSV